VTHTMQEAAQTALNVRDAVNLSGVLAAFHEIVSNVIWPERTGCSDDNRDVTRCNANRAS